MKKGQERTTAAGLISTIAGLIVLYIIFLPPSDRAALLGENTASNTGTATTTQHTVHGLIKNETIFKTSPGKIYYQKLDEYEYNLPAFTLFKTTSASVLATINNFRIRNGVFDKIRRNISFVINDLQNTDNVLLSFNTPRHSGTLTIKLNGAVIYEFEIDTASPQPVALNKANLKQGNNILEFSVSGVGLRFWKTNEYSFSGVKVVGDITDTSRQESRNTFYISPEEGQNIEKVLLKFNPDCKIVDVGMLDITINGRNVFTGVPDCGTLNTYDIPPSVLNVGKNSVSFKTERGSYLIDQIHVKTTLKQPVQPTFYFELKDDLFRNVAQKQERCGDIDGVCPSNECGKDLDKDCCFKEYPNGFWCDVKTEFVGDRCVGFVDSNQCNRCPSGYKDKDRDAPDACKDMCGDDSDGECPNGCLPKYDKDCCFNLPSDQYWCEDLPITGEDFRCMSELTESTCQNCPTGYKAEGTSFDCKALNQETKAELKSGVDVILVFSFTESRDDKEADVWINGKQTGFATRESSYRRNINDLVEPGTNSILIKPKTDLDIRELEVKFD